MKKQVLAFLLAGLCLVASAFAFGGCEKQENQEHAVNTTIARSVEMEEYIVAGYELQVAMTNFQQQMSGIDWSTLSSTTEENGEKVIYLPIQRVNLEEKLRAMNAAKKALQKKFPAVLTLSSEQCGNIMELCIEQSITVSNCLLAMGINVFQPTKKPRDPEILLLPDEALTHLRLWMQTPNYVETVYLEFENGHFMFHHNGSTNMTASVPYYHNNGNKYYNNYHDSPIRVQIHTHSMAAGTYVSDEDLADKWNDQNHGVNNVTYGIYHGPTGRISTY